MSQDHPTHALPPPAPTEDLEDVASRASLPEVLLLASVARIVMPMFQGTAAMPARAQTLWLASVLLMLPAAAWWRWAGDDGRWLLATVVVHVALFAGAALWLQWRSPRVRRGPLLWSWRGGQIVLVLAAVLLAGGARGAVLAAALGLGIALPLLLTGMALEIVAFLGWIQLHRSIGRGVQLPGVQRLMPARERGIAVAGQSVAGALVVVAAWHPGAWLARVAGASVCAAWLLVDAAFLNTNRRVRRFLADAVKPSR